MQDSKSLGFIMTQKTMNRRLRKKNYVYHYSPFNARESIISCCAWIIFLLPFSAPGLEKSSIPPIVIEPDSYLFAPRQINTVSPEKFFFIRNQSDTPLTLVSEDIMLIADGPQSSTLSVLTYNLWFDSQSWPARFVHMLREIRELNPDIIGLQEVIQRAHLENQAKSLADSLGYHYYFASRDPETSVQRFGNAIVSRYPIEETNWRALMPLNDYRTAVHARINVEGNVIDFYNTHIHNAAVNVHIREAQIHDMLDFIETTNGGGFIFVTGDFNANPDWPEMDLMYQDFNDTYPIFHEDHLEPEHGTLNHHLGHQQRRIDYIFFHQGGSNLLKPVSANVVLNTPSEAGVWGSDHFGVFAQFQILSDADAFFLKNIPEESYIKPSDSLAVSVSYTPSTIGHHQAFLKVLNETAGISGEGFDATISTFPWTEDFNNIEIGALPRGWETNTGKWEVSPAGIAGNQNPALVFLAIPQTEDSFMVNSPLINTEGLDSMLLSFKHAATTSGNNHDFNLRLICKAGGQTYQVTEWVNPDNLPSGKVITSLFTLHGIGSGTIQLAWIVEGETSDTISWFIDDIELEALPALAVSPPSHHFGNHQINTISEQIVFTLGNNGSGIIQITADDIRLTGEHAHAFTLTNLSDMVMLTDTVRAELLVAFNPVTTGKKTAQIEISGKIIPLFGEAFDPSINSLPWTEDFSGLAGGGLPLGWTSNSAHWGAFNAANAGGEAPEMVFWWQPETSGRFYLVTPEITTTETDSLTLSFKHRIRNFGAPGKYTLSVAVLSNGEEYLIHNWVDPDIQPAEEFSAMLVASTHGIGQSPFQIAWVFDGTTDNITQWDIDDISLSALTETPILEVHPESKDFGRQTIRTSSAPHYFVMRNRGGGNLIIKKENIHIAGPDAAAFNLGAMQDEISLAPFESAQFSVTFRPESSGTKQASLSIHDTSVSLTGLGTDIVPYFIYSDFTIAANGRQFTNVEGFREVPAFARNGSILANDIADQGEFGGVVLQLAYNLSLVSDFTVYYMWAYPYTNISGYDQIVIYARANVPVTNIRLQMQDTSGVQGTDGAGYTYFDAGTQWQKITIPVSRMDPMPWATNLPDMTRIQKIDLVFEKDYTSPGEAIVYIDLIGFEKLEVSADPPRQHHMSKMYPNPADQLVNIIAEHGSVVSLIDMTGRVMMAKESFGTMTQIDVSAMKKGLYLVRIEGVSGWEIKKLSVY